MQISEKDLVNYQEDPVEYFRKNEEYSSI